ncbi:aminopeptidase [Prolixibacteraceae bacterium JC049]|nr:aminopeptidase [Prolixibacteraceae bacterium JC049]
MNRRNFIIWLFSTILFIFTSVNSFSSELKNMIEALPGVESVKTMDGNQHFNAKYEVMFRQPLDHKNPSAGSFLQRIFVAHFHFQHPMVLITEGYAAHYASRKSYINELTTIVDGNQICVEHRYFGKSVPKDDPQYKYLTVANAAADHHAIIQQFKKLYQGKWLTTGISKGGQTTLFHRSLYPNDVDVSVPYVAPLNFGIEDGRHEPFIDQVGTPKDRKAIRNFQLEVLKRRDKMLPMLKEVSDDKGYTYRISLDEVLDYMVLEYSFAFWQWGTKRKTIPTASASDKDIFNHLMAISSCNYFAIEGIAPTLSFFIQAAKELGYYGYDTKPFEQYLKIKTAKGYLNRIFIPENLDLQYEKRTMKAVKKFVKKEDPKMLFIYGEVDPWSAPAVQFKNKKNMIKLVKKGGSHRARILNMPTNQKNRAIKQLEEWLE